MLHYILPLMYNIETFGGSTASLNHLVCRISLCALFFVLISLPSQAAQSGAVVRTRNGDDVQQTIQVHTNTTDEQRFNLLRVRIDGAGKFHMGTVDGPPLEQDTFYDYIGATALRDDYRRRTFRHQKWGMVGSGVLSFSLPSMLIGALGFWCRQGNWACKKGFDVTLAVGAVATALSTALLLYAFSDPDPLNQSERQALAEGYNAKLRKPIGH